MGTPLYPQAASQKGEIVFDHAGKIIIASGSTLLTAGTTGYAAGCVFFVRGTGRYTNIGDEDSCVFVPESSEGVQTLTAAATLTAASPRTIILNSATGFAVTLPAPADGLAFRFFVGTTPPTSGNHTIVTASNAAILYGTGYLATIDTGTDGAIGAAADTVTFVASTAVAGDWCEIFSDGTSWFVRGGTSVGAAMTITDE